jgi:hypothetical protein
MKITGYFSAFAFVSIFTGIGCSSAPASTDDSQATDEEIKSGMYACKSDSDCVAISKGGCCPNGWNVAVNKSHVKQYEESHTCTEKVFCPLYVILDRRVAECNVEKSKCEMVQPEDIRCGGFTVNPHSCPKGWTCEYGHVPDVPGNCVQN